MIGSGTDHQATVDGRGERVHGGCWTSTASIGARVDIVILVGRHVGVRSDSGRVTGA